MSPSNLKNASDIVGAVHIAFIKSKVAILLIEYHNFDIKDGQGLLVKALQANFSITIHNSHENGGVLMAINKAMKN